ncbi:hypothetical protein GCM10009799_25700 [Nocardiopsis rhodophaea]|uniref:Uncharacterized protein n=1 Tax=Nocardiopsis rhodophaea TaxID=280238 RepID=A0ABN2T376_9ACTN
MLIGVEKRDAALRRRDANGRSHGPFGPLRKERSGDTSAPAGTGAPNTPFPHGRGYAFPVLTSPGDASSTAFFSAFGRNASSGATFFPLM